MLLVSYTIYDIQIVKEFLKVVNLARIRTPSLLPQFKGINTHERAIEAEVAEHGASVHFVSSELDGGPMVLQASVSVLSLDSPKVLAARVLVQEHLIYPIAIKWFCEGRLKLQNNAVLMDGQLLPEQGIQFQS